MQIISPPASGECASDPRTSKSFLLKRPDPKLLSLVMPFYNEEEVIPLLRREVSEFLNGLPYPCELVAVNDGSTDRTLDLLVDWCENDPRIKVINLSRNFGHQYAATAGVDYTSGDAVVLMDSDLQDPLDVIQSMVAEYRKGFDVVCGQRIARAGESPFKRLTAWLFYRSMRTLCMSSLPPDVGDFRLMSRRCVNALTEMRELHRFLRGMVAWVGYPQTCVRYERHARAAGVTKYPLKKMLKLAWTAAVSFSALPLKLSFFGAGVMMLVAIEEGIRAIAEHMSGQTIPGWTSLMVMLCLSNAALMAAVGFLGEYVGRIYEEGKHRPLYLVAGAWNLPECAEDPAMSPNGRVYEKTVMPARRASRPAENKAVNTNNGVPAQLEDVRVTAFGVAGAVARTELILPAARLGLKDEQS